MTSKDTLGDRMKQYESVTQSTLMKRTPVIIRVDGRAFHTFTKRLKNIDPSLKEQPYSDVMADCMIATAIHLTHYVQGAVLAYSQSDEISLFLRDWDNYETQQWFGGNIQKIVSLTAAMASMAFYARYEKYEPIDYLPERPVFDSRVYNLPKEEVTNYFIWRQKDAIRNSINMLGQYHFSHKQLQGKNINAVLSMLIEQKNIDWTELPTLKKRGFCVPKKYPISSRMETFDGEIPVFTEDRDYIERWVGDYLGEF